MTVKIEPDRPASLVLRRYRVAIALLCVALAVAAALAAFFAVTGTPSSAGEVPRYPVNAPGSGERVDPCSLLHGPC